MGASDITVIISDGENSISGASVILTNADDEDVEETTNDDGKAQFNNIPFGTYELVASKSGYVDYEGTLTVSSSAQTANVVMEAIPVPVTRTIHIDVVNASEEPIVGASVVIGDTTRTTGDAGGCNFADMLDDTYSVEVSADGYTTKTESITTDETHTSFIISLVEV